MWHSSNIGLYGFSMALNIDCLHNLGTLFSVKHLLRISSSQLCKVGPRLFSCTLSMPAAFLFMGDAIPFLYSSSEKGYALASLTQLHLYVECLGLLDMT